MKAIFTLAMSLVLTTAIAQKFPTIELGADLPAAQTEVIDIAGKKASFDSYSQENGLLVIFSCNTCPYVIAWEDRYNELHDFCAANKIGMVLVNSNEAKRSGADSVDEMVKHAKEQAYKADYVVDENSAIANAFGAKSTPHVFLFDGGKKLAYKGAIDDNMKKDKVSKTYLKDAMQKLVAGEKIDPATTKSVGCSIKRTS